MIPITAGIAISLFIIIFIFALLKGTKDFDARRARLIDEFAGSAGFESGDAQKFKLRERIRQFPIIGVAENTIAHAAWKDDGKTRFFVFDQVRVTKGGSSVKGGLLTICLAETNALMGPDTVMFTVRSRTEAGISRSMAGGRLGLSPVIFGYGDFDNRFVAFSQAPDTTLQLFDNQLLDFIMKETEKISMPVTIQIRGKSVAVHNTGDQPKTMKKTEDLEALFKLAERMVNALCD